jgi:hypothetical protein
MRLNQMTKLERECTLAVLPQKLAIAGQTERLRNLLTNFEFLQAKLLAMDTRVIQCSTTFGFKNRLYPQHPS